jgi:hypothetical protein
MDNTFGLQEKQDAVVLEVSIEGFQDWQDALEQKTKLGKTGVSILGKNEASWAEVSAIDSRMNGLTLESAKMNALMNAGYILEELVVSFTSESRAAWGKSVWYKVHPSYSNLDHELRKYAKDGASDYAISLVASMFATEHAGDQLFTLISTTVFGALLMGYSAESIGFVFHKSIVFHKAVFVLPKKVEVAAA